MTKIELWASCPAHVVYKTFYDEVSAKEWFDDMFDAGWTVGFIRD
jgi:hypothetical protein